MKLYLISRTEPAGWDEFISAVVCSENEEAARMTHPDSNKNPWDGKPHVHGTWISYGTWIKPCDVVVREIGMACLDIKVGVVLDSFNAG